MIEARVFCNTCLRWLEHDQRYCPLFPEVEPPYIERKLRTPILTPMGLDTHESVRDKKWSECSCLIHTCYDAHALGIKVDPENAPTYHDSI